MVVEGLTGDKGARAAHGQAPAMQVRHAAARLLHADHPRRVVPRLPAAHPGNRLAVGRPLPVIQSANAHPRTRACVTVQRSNLALRGPLPALTYVGLCSRAVRQLASLAPETTRGQSCKNFIAVQRFNVDSGVGGRQGASPGLRGRRLRSWASAPQRARREPRCRPRATARAAAGGREAQLSASLFGSAAWTQRFLARSCVGVGSRACIGTRRARGTWRT